ncbi:hypothetical protein C0995_011134 [Termitomyces sp. Mi166|nr:hypothetical protein C0995_011134 [Termitomyces sp. Mi166\
MAGKTVTLEELRAHKSKENFYVLIHGKGQDATEAFEDVGHSDEARALLPDMLVGDFAGGDIKLKSGAAAAQASRMSGAVEKGSNLSYFLPLALLGAYFAYRFYSSSA